MDKEGCVGTFSHRQSTWWELFTMGGFLHVSNGGKCLCRECQISISSVQPGVAALHKLSLLKGFPCLKRYFAAWLLCYLQWRLAKHWLQKMLAWCIVMEVQSADSSYICWQPSWSILWWSTKEQSVSCQFLRSTVTLKARREVWHCSDGCLFHNYKIINYSCFMQTL